MKFVRIALSDGPCWGVVEGDHVLTLTQAPYEQINYDGRKVPLEQCTLLPPCQPTKIVCVGKNYAEHARELGGEAPGFPVLFLKGLNTLNGPDGEVTAPAFVQRLDYEGELAIVIRRRAKNVRAEDWADYVLGFTCLNDITARDVQQHDGQWTRAKSMDGFCPVGPCVVDGLNPARISLETRLNGVAVQRGNTADLMTPIPQLLEFITASMTLEPGDVIATGTPAGIGPMSAGDRIEVEIAEIGVLSNRVV